MTDPYDDTPLPSAQEAVAAVIRHYTVLLLEERRAAAPDEERMARLSAAQQEAREDESRLGEAGAEERTRIAERYAALLNQLSGE